MHDQLAEMFGETFAAKIARGDGCAGGCSPERRLQDECPGEWCVAVDVPQRAVF